MKINFSSFTGVNQVLLSQAGGTIRKLVDGGVRVRLGANERPISAKTTELLDEHLPGGVYDYRDMVLSVLASADLVPDGTDNLIKIGNGARFGESGALEMDQAVMAFHSLEYPEWDSLDAVHKDFITNPENGKVRLSWFLGDMAQQEIPLLPDITTDQEEASRLMSMGRVWMPVGLTSTFFRDRQVKVMGLRLKGVYTGVSIFGSFWGTHLQGLNLKAGLPFGSMRYKVEALDLQVTGHGINIQTSPEEGQGILNTVLDLAGIESIWVTRKTD
ncbi:MAG: hypothetical protein HQ564_06875 [Candidatus Saganbacteria bacterium]|nr:hypothetical protein [Candidatus Saganbacteria bacterium]